MNPLFGSIAILAIAAPPIGCVALIVGMLGWQFRTVDGNTEELSIDRFTYSREITIAYAVFGLSFLASVLFFWTLLGWITAMTTASFVIIQVGMGRLGNLAATRLRDLGKTKWLCLLGSLPIVAHGFFLWLAFATPDSR